MPEPDPQTLVNRFLGPYHLDRRLTEGGTAEIFLAQSPSSERNRSYVAKVLKADLVGDRICSVGIRYEYDTLKELDLPGSPRVLRFGEVEGRPGFIMQFIDGPNLHRMVKEAHRVSRWQLFLDMVRLTARLHQQQVIHNDLKPENFIFDRPEGRLYLIDFGNAKRPVKRGITTMFFQRRVKRVRGTPTYMAPELLRRKQPCYQSDVFALGACAGFLLTNHPLRTRQEVTDSIRRNHDAGGTRFNIPELSRELNQILSHSVYADPEARPDNAASFLQLLLRHPVDMTATQAMDARLIHLAQEDQIAGDDPAT